MHLTNHDYFDNRKNPKTSIWAPCQDKNGLGSGISLVYLCIFVRMARHFTSRLTFNCIYVWIVNQKMVIFIVSMGFSFWKPHTLCGRFVESSVKGVAFKCVMILDTYISSSVCSTRLFRGCRDWIACELVLSDSTTPPFACGGINCLTSKYCWCYH